MTETLHIEFYITFGLSIVSFGIVLYNFLSAPKLKNDERRVMNEPLISILIPARNEEKNIGKCLDSIVSQSYKNYEVIILDDESEDLTNKIVREYLEQDNKWNICE